jgi:threonyl-tRNA synthetase
LLQVLSDHDRPNIEKRVDSIIKDNQRFQRVVVSRDEALGMFQENKFKVSWGGTPVDCRSRLQLLQVCNQEQQHANMECTWLSVKSTGPARDRMPYVL